MHKLLFGLFLFFFACKASTSPPDGITFTRVPLQSYPGWPEKLCDAKVDSTFLAALSESDFIALKFTNNTNYQVVFDLCGGPVCDTLFYLPHDSAESFVETSHGDSSVSTGISCYFGRGKKISIPQDSSAIVLADGRVNLQLFSREDFYCPFHADSANVMKGYKLVIRRGRDNGVLWDSINVVADLTNDF